MAWFQLLEEVSFRPVESDGFYHIDAGAHGVLQRSVHQAKNNVSFVADRLNVHNPKSTESDSLVVTSSHDQIAGERLAFQKRDDGCISAFQSGEELPGEGLGSTNGKQSIRPAPEQLPERVETFVEAVEHADFH